MPQIEGWATLHSPSAGAGPLVLTAPVIEALEQPLTRAKYYAEAEDEAGTLLWEFGVCSIRGTVIVKRDVINSSAGVGTAVEFPGTGVRLSVSEPVVAAVGPGGEGSGDVTGPASSTNNALTQFNGTSGKQLKVLGLTGLLKVASGVPAVAVADTDYATPASVAAKADSSVVATKADASAVASALAAKADASAVTTALAGKQDTLASGTNIKTVNGESLLGSGNLAIAGGAGLVDGDYGLFTVTDGGTSAALNPDTVTNDAIPDGEITSTKLAGVVTESTADERVRLGIDQFELARDYFGVSNGTYPLDIDASFPYTIRVLKGKASEPMTATVQIGATNVTGLVDVALGTTKSSTNATAANAVVETNDVTITFAGIDSTADVHVKLVVDRVD
ncbi:hypothetical protein [Luteitalea sp.]